MYRFMVRLGFVAIGVAAIVLTALALSHWSPLVDFLHDHPQPVGPDGWGPDLGRPDQLGHVARIMLPIVAGVVAADVLSRRLRRRRRAARRVR
jgi:hypothetical protein